MKAKRYGCTVEKKMRETVTCGDRKKGTEGSDNLQFITEGSELSLESQMYRFSLPSLLPFLILPLFLNLPLYLSL